MALALDTIGSTSTYLSRIWGFIFEKDLPKVAGLFVFDPDPDE